MKNNIKKIADLIYHYRFVIALSIFVICILFEINGSSIGCWNNFMNGGVDDSGNILFGISRTVRSDEFAVFTPMTFSQYFDGYHYFSNVLRADKTDVSLVYGLPILNLIQIYRPFQIGYLFLGLSRGLSFFWCGRFIALFLVSFEFFMILTKKSKLLSIVGAFLLTFAPQVRLVVFN